MIRRGFFAFLFFTAAVALGGEHFYDGEIQFGGDSKAQKPTPIGANDVAACRFSTDGAVQAITVFCPSYDDNDGDLTLSLYHAGKNGAEPGELAAEKTFVNFADNAALTLELDKPVSGELLWTLHSGRGRVGVWNTARTTKGVQSYFNGKPIDRIYRFSLKTRTRFPFAGSIERYNALLADKSTAPSEKLETADEPVNALDVMADTWDAVDELGRALPDERETGPVRPEKQVGIFYWTWHGTAHRRLGPFDNTKIIAEHPEAVGDAGHSAWGPFGAPHHWGEPLFGYYTTCDEWIHRKHAELLADAGIDAIIFDATNGTLTWMDSVEPLMKVYAEARRDGVRTPKFAFMLPFWNLEFNAVDLVQLYRDIYRDGRYRELWFYWEGKPLVYGIPDAIDRRIEETSGAEREELIAVRNFFAFRPGQPSYTDGPGRPDHWSWLEVWPQNGYVKRYPEATSGADDATFEMVSVGVAQNHSSLSTAGKKGLAAMNDRNVFGRRYSAPEGGENGKTGDSAQPQDSGPDALLHGENFQQQWNRAFELDPDFVFVTGWNEWVAGRFTEWQGLKNAFPDQYNEEFSRDTEPSRGRLMDTYYLQLAANVRRFKGVRPQPAAGAPKTIDLGRNADAQDPWADVEPLYRDYRGDVKHRDFDGYGSTHYVNDSGRNDFIRAKVSRDDANLYFLIETDGPLTPPQGADWLRLFIAFPGRKDVPNWKTFAFMVEETADGAVLKKSDGGWKWSEAAPVARRVSETRLELAVPLEALGLKKGEPIDLQFKWSDNMRVEGDILDFYQFGDAAPDGRFVYRYKTARAD